MTVKLGYAFAMTVAITLSLSGCAGSAPAGISTPSPSSDLVGTNTVRPAEAPTTASLVPTPASTSPTLFDPALITADNITAKCATLLGPPDEVARQLGQKDVGYSWQGSAFSKDSDCSLAPPGQLGPQNSFFIIVSIKKYDGTDAPYGIGVALATNHTWTLEQSYTSWFHEPLLSRINLLQHLLDQRILTVKQSA